jgi:hypothetical protein
MITNMDAGIAVRISPSPAKFSNPLRPTLVRELGRGPKVADRLAAACGAEEVHAVADGAVGVSVLALRHAGTYVDAAVFQQLTTSLTTMR